MQSTVKAVETVDAVKSSSTMNELFQKMDLNKDGRYVLRSLLEHPTDIGSTQTFSTHIGADYLHTLRADLKAESLMRVAESHVPPFTMSNVQD